MSGGVCLAGLPFLSHKKLLSTGLMALQREAMHKQRSQQGETAQRPRDEDFREQQPKDTVSCRVAMGTQGEEVTEVRVPCQPSCPSLVDAWSSRHKC